MNPDVGVRSTAKWLLLCVVTSTCVIAGCGGESLPDIELPHPPEDRALSPELTRSAASVILQVDRALGEADGKRAAEELLQLGFVYDAGAVFDLAGRAYRAALTLDPEREDAAVHLARMEQELGNPRVALELLERVDADGAHGAAVAWRSGLLHLALDELEAADRAFSLAVELAPADVSGWIGRARVALQRERFAEAETILQEALARSPGDSEACELLARALRARGDGQGALSALSQRGTGTAAWRDPWMVTVMDRAVGAANELKRAEALLAARRPGEALVVLDRLAREDPQHSTVASMRASILLSQGRATDALRVVDDALVSNPDYFRLHLNRALILRSTRDATSALPSARRAVALLPPYASGHALLAELYADLGAYTRAREALDEAVRLGASARVVRSVETHIAMREAERTERSGQEEDR